MKRWMSQARNGDGISCLVLKVLADFAQYGRIGRARTDTGEIHLCPATKKVLQDYEQYGKDRLQLRPATLQKRSGELTIFLDFLSSRKARTPGPDSGAGSVRISVFSGSLEAEHRLATGLGCAFLSSVSDHAWDPPEGSQCGATNHPCSQRCRYPLGVGSRAHHQSCSGRSIAVRPKANGITPFCLLACRLGLRAGDIRTLKLDHLHWEDSRIEFTQSKTTTPLSLPLTEEVGEALIDYLRSGRPKTADREVFLKLSPPFGPFGRNNNLYGVVTYWRRLAGITFRSPRKRGIHSLRHTLATRLLEQGTPFPTIADILGHTSLESTRIYAKADVEALRSVALDPEEVNHAE